jgi:hypothetical protein
MKLLFLIFSIPYLYLQALVESLMKLQIIDAKRNISLCMNNPRALRYVLEF